MQMTKIITAHEEQFVTAENVVQKIIGVLMNIDETEKRISSFLYLFNQENNTYVFFDTIVDLNDYILYGDRKVKRAYMKEDDFDDYYDNGIKGEFNDYLKWSR